MSHAQHTLASVFVDIQNKDPRIDELRQNAPEFWFTSFAYLDFRDTEDEMTLSSVANYIELYVGFARENVGLYCESIEEIREKRGENWTRGSKQDDEDFFELLDVFEEKWKSADFKTKVEFVEAQFADLKKVLAE